MTFKPLNKFASKLSPEKVFTIRRRYAAREATQIEMAQEYRVSIGTIRNIIKGVTWQDTPQVESEAEVESQIQRSQALFAALPVEAPPAEPTPKEQISPEDHAAAIAALAKQARERKGSDNAAEAAREETRDDSKDTNEVQTARPTEANPTDAAGGVRDRDAGSPAGEGGAAATSTVPSRPARGAGSDEG